MVLLSLAIEGERGISTTAFQFVIVCAPAEQTDIQHVRPVSQCTLLQCPMCVCVLCVCAGAVFICLFSLLLLVPAACDGKVCCFHLVSFRLPSKVRATDS